MSASKTQRSRIEELKRRIREVTGQEPVFGTMPGCPPEMEEAFLQRVLEFESAEEKTLFFALEDAGIALPAPDVLDDAQTNKKLWEVAYGLADLHVYIHNTDHLSDRELYTELWRDVLLEHVKLPALHSTSGYHIDMTCGAEDERVYLQYYADEQTRRDYAAHFPEVVMPEHRDPPYDRDRLMPDG